MSAHPSPKHHQPAMANEIGVLRVLVTQPGQPQITPLRWPNYLKLPGWKHFARTWVMGLAQALAAAYLVLVHWANPIPHHGDLKRLNVKVIGTQRLSPHLTVETKDGNQRNVEFATAIGAQGTAFQGLDRQEQRALLGCNGVIEVVPIRMMPGDRLRIWSLECGDTRLSFTSAAEYFARDVKIAKFCLAVYLAMAGCFTALLYWLDRRDSKGDKK